MFKRLSSIMVRVVLFAALSLGIGQGAWTLNSSSALAEETKKECVCKEGCDCDHCSGKVETCPCGQKTQEQPAAKCAKCGHKKCPSNCDRCPDCMLERQSKKPQGY